MPGSDCECGTSSSRHRAVFSRNCGGCPVCSFATVALRYRRRGRRMSSKRGVLRKTTGRPASSTLAEMTARYGVVFDSTPVTERVLSGPRLGYSANYVCVLTTTQQSPTAVAEIQSVE